MELGDCLRHLATASSQGEFLEDVLLREQVFSRTDLLHILEGEYFCLGVDLTASEIDDDLVGEVPAEVLLQRMVLPLSCQGKSLAVAMADPDDTAAREAVSRALARPVVVAPRVALRNDLMRRLQQSLAAQAAAPAPQPAPATDETAATMPATAPARSRGWALELPAELTPTNLVDRLLGAAVQRGASDIHIEPKADCLSLRMRIDGTLTKVAQVPASLAAGVASRIKIMGEMDVAERRLPQDGRCSLPSERENLDLRIASTPTQYGEKIVIRLLRATEMDLDLGAVGMPPSVRTAYDDVVHSGHGFYLVTGPTGSGKTTTLYATLNAIDCETNNVVTFEDPIEYTLERTTQTQIRNDIGLTFAAGLRSSLRQDPDVILLGEIRDAETAEIACRAALTGHKVISTLHTNDAAQSIPRLTDMGLAPHLLAATLGGVLAQRLLRGICPHCKEAYPPSEHELAVLGYPSISELYRGAGCGACRGTGYRGRFAVFEYLPVTEAIRSLIMERASALALRDRAIRGSGMIPMVEFARRAVTAGRTTVEDALRVVLANHNREQLCPKCQQAVSLDFAVCPYCETLLKDECKGCGRSMDPTWEVCPHCGAQATAGRHTEYCRQCQAPLPAGQDSCPFCGGDQ